VEKVCKLIYFIRKLGGAAAQIPMKRELKGAGAVIFFPSSLSCSPNPYEEGTERLSSKLWLCHPLKCCSPNPYEEGTESIVCSETCIWFIRAAAQIPMKRELKD